jgi:hypothetical protein
MIETMLMSMLKVIVNPATVHRGDHLISSATGSSGRSDALGAIRVKKDRLGDKLAVGKKRDVYDFMLYYVFHWC